MPTPRIKICGVKTPDALDAAIASRAEYVGFNFFPPSPRCAAPHVASGLAARSGDRIERVGVFVDADDAFLAEHISAGLLSAVQLHGDETPERVAQVKARFGVP